MSLTKKETNQIFIMIIGVQLLILPNVLFSQIPTLFRLDFFFGYMLILAAILTLLLLKFFKRGSKILLIGVSLISALSITSLLVWVGENDRVESKIFLVEEKEYGQSRTNGVSFYNLELISFDGEEEIKLRGVYELYRSCGIGDRIRIDYNTNFFCGLETYFNAEVLKEDESILPKIIIPAALVHD